MADTLEARKLRLRDLLAEVEDEGIILQLEMLLKPQTDFWDELTPQEQADIEEALEQLDGGEGIPYEEFMQQLRKKNEALAA